MALQDLLDLSQNRKKIGLSEERINAVLPIIRKYVAFWREYPDLFVDFLVRGSRTEEKEGEFKFFFYQRIFIRSITRYQYVYAVFPRRVCAGYNRNVIEKNLFNCWKVLNIRIISS